MSRPSLLPSSRTLDSLPSVHNVEQSASEQDEEAPRRVQFAPTNDVKVVTPLATSFSFNGDEHSSPASPYASSSDLSSPSDEQSIATSTTAKTLASRLSFWSRLSKRTSTPPTPLTPTVPEEPPERESLDTMIKEQEPDAVLSKVIETLAPAPASPEEQHSELEDKIVKEVIREFSKGGMYFAYTFGAYILHSSQSPYLTFGSRHYTLPTAETGPRFEAK